MAKRQERWKKQVIGLLASAATFGFGGCLGLNPENLLRFGAAYAATEFLLDSDLFDLFPDGTAAGG